MVVAGAPEPRADHAAVDRWTWRSRCRPSPHGPNRSREPPPAPDRRRVRTRRGRRHRPPQVQLRPVGRRREPRQPDGVDGRPGDDPGRGPDVAAVRRPLSVHGRATSRSRAWARCAPTCSIRAPRCGNPRSQAGGSLRSMTLAANLPADPVQRHLEAMLGAGATFREGQREAIEAVVAGRSRALVVQRTGWGKSLVYWIATRVRRDAGHGPTLIISPLLSLMRNQIAMARPARAAGRDDQLRQRDDWADVEAELAADEIDVLLDLARAPRATSDFATRVLPSDPALDRAVRGRRGALHLRLGPRLPARLPAHRPDPAGAGRRVPVLATTATANDRVVDDVAEQLGDGVAVIRGPLARDSLRLDAIPLARPGGAPRLARRAPPGHARQRHRLLPDGRRHAARRRLAPAPQRHRRPRLQRRPGDGGARGARGGAARRTRSRRWSRPSPSAWASTSPTSASSSTTSGRARRSPTTSRSAAPDGPSSARTGSSCRAARTTRSPSTSSRTAFPPTVHMQEILAALEGGRLDDARRRSRARSTCRTGRSSRRSSCSRSTAPSRATAAATSGRRCRGSRTRSGSRGVHRDAPHGARADAGLRRHDGLPDGVPGPAAQRPGCRRRAGTARTMAATRWPRDGRRGARRGTPSTFLRRDAAADRAARASGRDRRARDRDSPTSSGIALCMLRRPGLGEGRGPGPGRPGVPGSGVRGPPRRRPRWRRSAAAGARARARVGHGRAVHVAPGHGRGVRGAAGVAARAAVRRVPARRRRRAPQEAMQNSAQQAANAKAQLAVDGRRRPDGPGPARRRPRGLALDADGRGVAAPRPRRRPGVPVRACGRDASGE